MMADISKARELRVFFLGEGTDTEREWRAFDTLVLPEVARRLAPAAIRLTAERLRLDSSCNVMAVRRAAARTDAFWIVVLGTSYGREASIEQCRAGNVLGDRSPSVLDLIVRQVLLGPNGPRGVSVHIRNVVPGGPPVEQRMLVLRAQVEKWRDDGRAQRYNIASELPPAEAIRPWVDQVRETLERLLTRHGLAPAAETAPASVEAPAQPERHDTAIVGTSADDADRPREPEPSAPLAPRVEPPAAERSTVPVEAEELIERITSPPMDEAEGVASWSDEGAGQETPGTIARRADENLVRSVPEVAREHARPTGNWMRHLVVPWPLALGVVIAFLVIGWLVLRAWNS
jgi:hypothetical protein